MAQRILIIGAGGTVGRAVAAAAAGLGHEIVAASRSGSPSVDVTDAASVDALFSAIGTVDAVVCAAGSVPFKPFAELALEDYRTGFENKALGQIGVVLRGVAAVADGGSFTLTSGILGAVPVAGGTAASVANGALEAFTMAAATGLPRGIRINTVSPNVLAESPALHRSFPGLIPVAAADVAQSYLRSIEGVETGKVFRV